MGDIQFPGLGDGRFTAKVLDNNASSSTVLEASQQIRIETVWNIDAESARVLGGEWLVAAYAESMGPGPERQIGPTQVVPLNGGTNYGTVILVPPNTLPDNPGPPNSGVYKIVTVLLLRNFGKITDVAAFDESPLLRIG
jgi:hypothetical protein